ncbi:hypothetical protein CCACVL1_29124 [Corchorus capsularis]|uniref:Uncharacterized protein n=1 Tax=Corchorus capsularis TaxID=210143 RepID=A0A1R3G3S9_COCAP|nr:hypothetical protein CCACVL1_29124 [Corchorus capsularis]
MSCLCVPEGEFDELLEHVPLSTRRKSLLSSTGVFQNQDESSNAPGLLSLRPCSSGDQVNQHLPQDQSPDCGVTASEHSSDYGTVGQASQFVTSCQDVNLSVNGNSQGSQAGTLRATKANGDASGIEKVDVGNPLPPHPVPSNVSEILIVDCADSMLLSLSENGTSSSAHTGVTASCKDVGWSSSGNIQGSQADKLAGTEASADASRLEKIKVGVPLSPNPENVNEIIKVNCADNILSSLSEDDINSSAGTIVMACQDVALPFNSSNSQGGEADQLKGTEANADASGMEKVNVGVPPPPNPVPSNVPEINKADFSGNMLLSLPKDDTVIPTCTGVMVNTMDNKFSDFTFDELDHIVLKDRRKLLLKRKLMESEKPALKGSSVGLAEDTIEYSPMTQLIDGEFMTDQNQLNDIPIRNVSNLCSSSGNGLSSLEQSTRRNKEDLQVHGESGLAGDKFNDIPDRSASDLLRTSAIESKLISRSERTPVEFMSCNGDDTSPASTTEIYCSTLNTSLKVKAEPLDYSSLQNPKRITFGNMVSVKHEEDISDPIDHMLLRDRMKLPTSVEDSEFSSARKFECSEKTEPGSLEFTPIISDAKPIRVHRPRKRKKTATDSVETALEEDAPGLLKVLLDQGVSVDEIKLYGESENDDVIDDSFNENSFSELEAVMTKLFSQRSSLMKFAPLRCTKGSRPSYCLACLFSLVEQTRYLQFRRWPVEWGWCRDLQSFIFVFKKHHRIVLERPEYGFATYFFQLVDSLPIDWQVKRLVTAMKLTSCGRITLIENKPLSVGEDLTEGEAKVLMEFGWTPDTGLGTMLNYCDRVVHDRKNESDSSEWRSKIGNLLVDGYNSGTIVSTSVVDEVIEQNSGENIHIKQEI